MSDRLIAQSLGIGKTTVGEYVCRAKVIGNHPLKTAGMTGYPSGRA
jgi:hypothetical protein